VVPRGHFWTQLSLFGLASGVYLWFIFRGSALLNTVTILLAGVLLRLLTLTGLPSHSDDHQRFFWDGALTAHHPSLTYSTTPEGLDLGQYPIPGLSKEQLARLNSPVYYSLYPPVCQSIWAFCYTTGGSGHEGFLWSLKWITLLAEMITMLMIAKLLSLSGQNQRLLAIYALNPLVISELTGNLHPEAFMICGLSVAAVFAFRWYKEPRWKYFTICAVAMAMAVNTKLLPLIFLPLVIRYAGWKRGVLFSAAVGLLSLVMFVPFLSQALWENLATSLELYFRQFEFNASVYYVVRELGRWKTGYNEIDLIGPALSLITFLICLFIYFRKPGQKQNPADLALAAFSIYLLFSTTVHPWYLAILAFLSVFATRTYGIIWTLLVFLSYSHYEGDVYREHYPIIVVEYSLLLLWFVFEKRIVGKGILSLR
jgi:hypothetical protein